MITPKRISTSNSIAIFFFSQHKTNAQTESQKLRRLKQTTNGYHKSHNCGLCCCSKQGPGGGVSLARVARWNKLALFALKDETKVLPSHHFARNLIAFHHKIYEQETRNQVLKRQASLKNQSPARKPARNLFYLEHT
jgi:DNA recombination-dependent growth factor C